MGHYPILRRKEEADERGFLDFDAAAEGSRRDEVTMGSSTDSSAAPALVVVRYSADKLMIEPMPVVEEVWVEIVNEGRQLATLACSPFEIQPLVVGYLYFQGLIAGPGEIRTLEIAPTARKWRLLAEVRFATSAARRPFRTTGAMPSELLEQDTLLASEAHPLARTLQLDPAEVMMRMRELYSRASHYQLSRGIHTAGLSDGQRLLIVAEDISRHHAMDKLIGKALQEGITTAGRAVCTTGRLSSGLVYRAYRIGVEILLSRTSPTQLALDMARKIGLTIVGYIRGDSFVVYSGTERVKLNGGTNC